MEIYISADERIHPYIVCVPHGNSLPNVRQCGFRFKSSLNILLIEDNPDDAFLIQDMLQSGKNLKIHFTLRDSSLPPEGRGLESLRKTYPFAPAIPIVVLTGFSDEALQLQALQEGAQDYLVKGKVTANC